MTAIEIGDMDLNPSIDDSVTFTDLGQDTKVIEDEIRDKRLLQKVYTDDLTFNNSKKNQNPVKFEYPITIEKRLLTPDDASIPSFPIGKAKYNDEQKLMIQYLQYNGLTRFLTDSFNDDMELVKIYLSQQVIEIDEDNWLEFIPESIEVKAPLMRDNGIVRPMYPRDAKNKKSYELQIYARMRYISRTYKPPPGATPRIKTTNLKKSTIQRQLNGEKRSVEYIYTESENLSSCSVYPLMVGSNYCWLNGKTDQELRVLGERPERIYGYFIYEGEDDVILLQDQLRYNKVIYSREKGVIVAKITYSMDDGSTRMMEFRFGKKEGHIKMKLPDRTPKKHRDINIKNGKKNKKKFGIGIIQFLMQIRGYTLDQIYKMIEDSINPSLKSKYKQYLIPSIVKKDINENIHEYLGEKKFGILRSSCTVPETRNGKIVRVESNKAFVEEVSNVLNLSLNEVYFVNMNKYRESEILRAAGIEIPSEFKDRQLCQIVAAMIEIKAGIREIDDRDDFENKKLMTGSNKCVQLWRSIIKQVICSLERKYKKDISENTMTKDQNGVYTIITDAYMKNSVMTVMELNTITNFRNSFVTKMWGEARNVKKSNVVQPMVKNNMASELTHLYIIDVSATRNNKLIGMRLATFGQNRFISYDKLSENKSIGIIKNLTLTSGTTRDPRKFIPGIFTDDTEISLFIKLVQGGVLFFTKGTLTAEFYHNGRFLGWCNPHDMYDFCKIRKITGQFSRTCSIVYVRERRHVLFYTDSNRIYRPVLLVNEDQVLVLDAKGLRGASFKKLVKNNCVEFIDVHEQKYAKIATNVGELRQRRNEIKSLNDAINNYKAEIELLKEKGRDFSHVSNSLDLSTRRLNRILSSYKYTHCEIDNVTLFGFAEAITPLTNHESAPRATGACKNSVQPIGVVHPNNDLKFDKSKHLAAPNAPIFDTYIGDNFMKNEGYGSSVIVAFMSLVENIEDAIIFDRSVFETSSKFSFYKISKYQATIKKEGVINRKRNLENERMTETVTEAICMPTDITSETKKLYDFITKDGLPYIGCYKKEGDCIIGKMTTTRTTDGKIVVKNSSVFMNRNDEGYVQDVKVFKKERYNGEIEIIVRVMLRSYRIPLIGDKFTARYAQKGTLGRLVNHEDMPFDERGVTPDVIFNSHAPLSRMTMGFMIELLASKYAVLRGEKMDATAFKEYDIDEFKRYLTRYGYNYDGTHSMTSGLLGERMEDCDVYMGPCYIVELTHQVFDKIQGRNSGAVTALTRTPVKGRKIDGGMRFGEMEIWAFESAGASATTFERNVLAANPYTFALCTTCGTYADFAKDIGCECAYCGKTSKNYKKVTTVYSLKITRDIMYQMGFKFQLNTETRSEYVEKRAKLQKIELEKYEGINPDEYYQSDSDEDEFDEEEDEELEEEDEELGEDSGAESEGEGVKVIENPDEGLSENDEGSEEDEEYSEDEEDLF